jgi:hypothetical protein
MAKAVGRIVVWLACLGAVRAPAPQVHDPYSDALQAYRSDPGGGITRLLALPDAEQSRGTRDFLSRPQLAADAACAAAMMQTSMVGLLQHRSDGRRRADRTSRPAR